MLPLLDIRTLFFVGAMNAFICAMMLFSSRRLHAGSRAGLHWAGLAEITLGTSMLLVALRGSVPDWASVWLANTLGSVGAIVLYQSVRLLSQQPPARVTLALAIGGLVGLQLWLGNGPDQHAARLLVTSAVQGCAALLSLPLLWRRIGIDPPVPLRWGLILITLFATVHVARVYSVLQHGVRVGGGGMVEGAPVLLVMVTLFALVPMAYALVVMGLVNGRMAGDLRKLAVTDTLTGLLTRRGFYDQANALLEDCTRRGQIAALMMLDLDHFKAINDRFGHAAGDRVLRHFARLLRDRLPADALLGRYGGEEFCVMLPCEHRIDAQRTAENLCLQVRASPADGGARNIPVTVSIGLATRPLDGPSLKDLLLAADRRVYYAKDAGRDQVVPDDDVPTTLRVARRQKSLVPV